MAISLTSIKCPECGAALPIKPGRTQMFCSYCGTPVIITNENEHIVKHIDVARIKESEDAKIVELKKLETLREIELKKAETARNMELGKRKALAEEENRKRQLIAEKKAKRAEKRNLKIICTLVGGVLSLIFISTGVFWGLILIGLIVLMWTTDIDPYSDDTNIGDYVRVPHIVSNCSERTFGDIYDAFVRAGFTDVEGEPLHDLTLGILKKPNRVESISINGNSVVSGGKKCCSDVHVVIRYHSF